MVDPIGIKAGTIGERRLAQVGAAQAAAAPQPVKTEAKVATAATQLSSTMAASAPVDAERVARIKKAIEDGHFPLVPSTVADRLLALKMEWNPNDEA
ncbi:MAG: flagellar biosynthesis anti-sigma factor FlgM [Pseudomonadota bacterium]